MDGSPAPRETPSAVELTRQMQPSHTGSYTLTAEKKPQIYPHDLQKTHNFQESWPHPWVVAVRGSPPVPDRRRTKRCSPSLHLGPTLRRASPALSQFVRPLRPASIGRANGPE